MWGGGGDLCRREFQDGGGAAHGHQIVTGEKEKRKQHTFGKQNSVRKSL